MSNLDMSQFLKLEKYSFGVGDRFARQGQAQLRAFVQAAEQGVEIIPVWNKSNREHLIIGSEPASTRAAAVAAVKALGWRRPFHVDADHIRLETVDRYLPHSDFYTLDVAQTIGHPAAPEALAAFVDRHSELVGSLAIPGIEHPFQTTRADLERVARKYLLAGQEAARFYRHILEAKGPGTFVTEVSMDETDSPQTPPELLVILAALADEAVPLQTIAPKFTGRFNKGVDYLGDLAQFEKQFNDDLAVLAFAVSRYGLPPTLKLSVHSGSDKFSIYRPIRRGLARFQAGLHLKTAGTTWLEEVIGLAQADGSGLALAKEIYAGALGHLQELCAPYATVIDIDASRLPSPTAVNGWNAEQFVGALRHDPANTAYNPHLRQLLHLAYKVAANMGSRYLYALAEHEATIGPNVTANLFERHIKPLFL
ncbi:MAG TPA: tagaturonate epimerase family protein [Dongiaceae bacterium]|nr:tagaturonate epimerase family protein [Dongiaceae bacterium]